MSLHIVNQIISSQVVPDPPFLLDLTDPITGAYLTLPAVACSTIKLSAHATKCLRVSNLNTMTEKDFGFVYHPMFGWVLDYKGIERFCAASFDTAGNPVTFHNGNVVKWYNQVYEVPRSAGFGTLDPATQQKHITSTSASRGFRICNSGYTGDPYSATSPGVSANFKLNQPVLYTKASDYSAMQLDAKGGDIFSSKVYHYVQMINFIQGGSIKTGWVNGQSLLKVSTLTPTPQYPLHVLGTGSGLGDARTTGVSVRSGSPVTLANPDWAGAAGSMYVDIDAEWNVAGSMNVNLNRYVFGTGVETVIPLVTGGVGTPSYTGSTSVLLNDNGTLLASSPSSHTAEWQHLVIYDNNAIKPYLPLLRETTKQWFK